MMSLAELRGFLTQIQHWSQPLPTASVARCPWYPSSRAWNTLSLSFLLLQSRRVMARRNIPSAATRRSSGTPRRIHELTKIRSTLHRVDWCWSGYTFLRTSGSKLWLDSNVVCHLVHLEQHATCHKRHVDSIRSHLVSIYRRQKPILHKTKEHTIGLASHERELAEELEGPFIMMTMILIDLPSGERMYTACSSPYMSDVSLFSAMNCSFYSSSSVGANGRLIKAWHCLRRSLGRFSSLRHAWLNLSLRKVEGTGKMKSCPSSYENHWIHERPGY